MRIVTAIALLVCAVSLGIAHAEDDEKHEPADSKEWSAKTIVYSIRNSPANELAATLAQFLEESGGRVAADPVSNVLLIQTTDENQGHVIALLQQLDRTPSTFRIQLHLLKPRGALTEAETASLSGRSDEVLDRIKSLKSTGRVDIANRIELTGIENQPAFLQVGQTVPLPTSSVSIPGRGASTNYRDVSIGMIFKVQARLSGESDIVLNTDFEKSEITPPSGDADEGSRSARQAVSQLTHQSTVRLQDGHSLLVGGLISQSSDGETEAYLVLSASIEGGKDAKPPAKANADATKRASEAKRREQYVSYIRKLFGKYDQNEDKKLDAEERSKMSKDCSDADTDKDGLVTTEEFIAWATKK